MWRRPEHNVPEHNVPEHNVPKHNVADSKSSGWLIFAAWLGCGAVWAFSFLSFAGPFAWPVAIAATWLTVRATSDWSDAIGSLAGLASFVLFVGLLHVGDIPCPATGSLTGSGGEVVVCGGLDSAPWLAVGAGLLVISLAWYRTARGRPSRSALELPTPAPPRA